MEMIGRVRLTYPWCTDDTDVVLQLSLLVCITRGIESLLHKAMLFEEVESVTRWHQLIATGLHV